MIQNGHLNALDNRKMECRRHGLQPTYVVCLCVLNNFVPVAHLVVPAPGRLGEIFCKRTNHQMFELRPVCLVCARQAKINRIGNRMGNAPEAPTT